MLPRVLAREQVEPKRLELFQSSGLRSYRQWAQRAPCDVAHAVDLSIQQTEELFRKVSIHLAPASRTAFDMFLESVNHPKLLRMGLPALDIALGGGLHYGGITELTGISGIGKSQWAMTLAVRCAQSYPDAAVLYFDTEHNFSARRLMQVAKARVAALGESGVVSLQALAEAVVKRIQVVRVDSMTDFTSKLKELEDKMFSMKVHLVIIDSVTALFLKSGDMAPAQRQHQTFKLARDLKMLSDTYQVFVATTNRATIATSDGGWLYTKPNLGETWAHCVTTRLVMERQPMVRVITITKSPVAGPIVQPFSIDETGVVPIADQEPDPLTESDFEIDDEFLEAEFRLEGLPSIEPAATLRSTQHSASEEAPSDDDDDDAEEATADLTRDDETQTGSGKPRHEPDEDDVFELVSDSNSEDEDDTSLAWRSFIDH